MSWLAKLYETYEAGVKLNLPDGKQLMPISHTLQNAHIKIIIDGSGNFKRAEVLAKTQVVLPATEKSAGRSGRLPPPHPLADKLQYVAKDYPDHGGRKPSFFSGYEQLIAEWANSPYSHEKVVAVYNYISKGRVISDLVKSKSIHVGDDGKLLACWPFESDVERPTPLIFKVLPTLQKDKRINKDKPEVEQGDALVCWQVETDGDLQAETWTDTSLQDSWIQFDSTNVGKSGLCFVMGEDQALATNHPAKLRHSGDKAKLLSANDSSGFTFRGRFTSSDANQAAGVGFVVTQKAHNALRWLIARQGFRNGDQVYVAWAVSGKTIPDPLKASWDLLKEPVVLQTVTVEDPDQSLDHGIDLGGSFALRFKKYLAGYHTKLEANEQIVVMGMDAATPGRMGVIYYRELLASEFLKRVEQWHSNFAWHQNYGKDSHFTGAPSPKEITWAAYCTKLGDKSKAEVNDKLSKATIERLLPCIVDAVAIPRDLVESSVHRVSNRLGLDVWEWEKCLGITCSLYRGTHQEREYEMALEEDRITRDYLYGRLLAVAEQLESMALFFAGERRETTAARLMQRFSDRPFSTWKTIEDSLVPYKARIQSKASGLLDGYKEILDQIHDLFLGDDYIKDNRLSGEYLLGYHCQRKWLRDRKRVKGQWVLKETVESECQELGFCNQNKGE
ncbi:MAG: type I-C CRISPR-associated protein Cas8c/Csd1 [Desulfobacteraceae bacterium 4572_35.1]|nr:MAG: type I-C CRISPR-associated protein Cas8c/Csd1 [Desulfobacteraceae bacterium 4572_35.1]